MPGSTLLPVGFSQQIIAATTALSVFLLWLWYFLGFNRIDNPVDLIVSIVWWAVIAAAVALIVRAEKRRQREIRTIYVSADGLFNSERGFVPIAPEQRADTMKSLLESLTYGFDKEDMPEGFACEYVVDSDEFKTGSGKKDADATAASEGHEADTWKGEVVTVAGSGGETLTGVATKRDRKGNVHVRFDDEPELKLIFAQA